MPRSGTQGRARTAAMEVSHLTKVFGGRDAVSDVSLRVAPGEVFGFLGPNRAGIPVGPGSGAEIRRRTESRIQQEGLNRRSMVMTATLKVTHKAIGAEVRRGTYDIVLDGEWSGSVDMNATFETPLEPGRHTLQVRDGRKSSRVRTFDAAADETVAFRCTGKNILPVFLASFAVPSLALTLRRE